MCGAFANVALVRAATGRVGEPDRTCGMRSSNDPRILINESLRGRPPWQRPTMSGARRVTSPPCPCPWTPAPMRPRTRCRCVMLETGTPGCCAVAAVTVQVALARPSVVQGFDTEIETAYAPADASDVELPAAFSSTSPPPTAPDWNDVRAPDRPFGVVERLRTDGACGIRGCSGRVLDRSGGCAMLEFVATSRAGDGVSSSSLGPAILLGGAGILCSRTIVLLTGDARTVLKRWVVTLTVVEMMIDLATGVAAARWWRSGASGRGRLALRAGAVATLLHAGRVLVFVIGRTGPWVDFDVRPEHRAGHRERWSWTGVVFAAVMSVLGVVGVVVVWCARRRSIVRSVPARRRGWSGGRGARRCAG